MICNCLKKLYKGKELKFKYTKKMLNVSKKFIDNKAFITNNYIPMLLDGKEIKVQVLFCPFCGEALYKN